MEWKVLKITLDFRCLKIKYVIISFFIVSRAIHSTQITVGWLLLSEGCILLTAITKQVIGNKKSNARKTEAFILEGKTYSVSHLQSDLQICQITYSSYFHLIIWIVWFFFPLSCKSLLYKLYMKPLPNMWFTIFFSFQSLPFNFIDGFFTLKKVLSLMWSQQLIFAALSFLLMTLFFELLVFWKAILYQLYYLLLPSPILSKRHRLDEWLQKQDPYIFCLQETYFSLTDIHRLKVREWKKVFQANGNQMKARLAIAMSEKIDLKIKTIVRDKEGHYQMTKGQFKKKTEQF